MRARPLCAALFMYIQSLVIHILFDIEGNTYKIEENTYFAILLLEIEESTDLIEENTYFSNR